MELVGTDSPAMGDKQPVDAHHTRYEAHAKILKALAHPSRLLIIDELARAGQRCVCELTQLVGADMSTVSKHLAILRAAQLVTVQKQGARIWYSLSARCMADLFRCIEHVLHHKSSLPRRLRCQREAPK